VFDLKGSLRGRFAKNLRNGGDREPEQSKGSSTKQKREKSRTFSDTEASSDDDSNASGEKHEDRSTGYLSSEEDDDGIILDTKDKRKSQEDSKVSEASSTMLDGDFIEFTGGRPLPLTDRAKAAFHMSILNVRFKDLILESNMSTYCLTFIVKIVLFKNRTLSFYPSSMYWIIQCLLELMRRKMSLLLV
jgi:hypothetical protein